MFKRPKYITKIITSLLLYFYDFIKRKRKNIGILSIFNTPKRITNFRFSAISILFYVLK